VAFIRVATRQSQDPQPQPQPHKLISNGCPCDSYEKATQGTPNQRLIVSQGGITKGQRQDVDADAGCQIPVPRTQIPSSCYSPKHKHKHTMSSGPTNLPNVCQNPPPNHPLPFGTPPSSHWRGQFLTSYWIAIIRRPASFQLICLLPDLWLIYLSLKRKQEFRTKRSFHLRRTISDFKIGLLKRLGFLS